MKKLLLAVAAALGFSGFSASATPIESGHTYYLQNVDYPQFYLCLPESGHATLGSASEATSLYFSATDDGPNKFVIRRNNSEGEILSTDKWWVAATTGTETFWTVDYVGDENSARPIVYLSHDSAQNPGSIGSDYDGNATSGDKNLYCDKDANGHRNWYVIDGDIPTGTTVIFYPAEGSLVDGANYYIFDNNTVAPSGANDRYGFFADQGAVSGVKQMPLQAYNSNSLTNAIYVWTAKQNADNPNQWYFINKSTGRYISNTNNTSATEIGYVTMEQYPGMNDTYFRLTNVSTNKRFDANCENSIDLSWWQGTGHPIQFYAAVEDGDAWQLKATVEISYTITCNFILDGEIFKTETVSGAPGTAYSFKAPQFYAGETITGSISKYNTVYNVPIELALPFKASTDLESATYQALAIHSSYDNATPYTLTFNGEAIKAPATAKTAANPYNDNQLFALIGSYEEGFKLYSKGAEQYVIAATSAATDVTLGDEDAATVWQVKASKVAGENYFCLLNGATTNQYLNLNAPQARVSEWTDNDGGSTMWAYGVSQPVVNTYNAFFANAATTFEGNEDMLKVVAEGQALVDALDPWSELTEEQIAAIDTVKSQLEVAVYRSQKKADIIKYFEASYTGKEDAASYADTLDSADTQAEIDATYADLMNQAMEMFQSDFENGAVLKNKRNGKYMTYYYDETEDPNDDEHIIITEEYRVNPAATIGAYFIAEFTDEGSVAPADRTFYLYNVSSKTYLQAQAANNTTVAPVTDKAEAALLKVVAGNNGFEMIITNALNATDAVVADNYINSNQTDTGHIVTWQYANDGGAFWIAEALPTFDNTTDRNVVIATMGKNDGEKMTELNAITFTIPANATVTGAGILTVTNKDGEVVATAPVVEAVALALEEDEDASETAATKEVTVSITPITDDGDYTINVSAGAFAVTSGTETLYSPALTETATVGTPSSIDEIQTSSERSEQIFDLQGRRILVPAHGLYIINGRKVVK